MDRHITSIWSSIALALAFLAGCGVDISSVVPRHTANHWQVLGIRGQVLDLTSGTASSIAPTVRAIVGDAVFSQLQAEDDADALFYCVGSPHGRYVACRMRDDRLCVIDMALGKSFLVRSPNPGRRLAALAWRPDESALLCSWYEGRPGESRQCRFYILSRSHDAWSWQLVDSVGVVTALAGPYEELSIACWEANDAFVFSDNMEMRRCDLKAGTVTAIGRGHAAYSLGPERVVFRTQVDHSAVFSLATQIHDRNAPAPRVLRGDDMEMNGWPCVSPDRESILFLMTFLSSIHGHAAISRDACVYSIAEDKFFRLSAGHGPAMKALGGAVWIAPPRR